MPLAQLDRIRLHYDECGVGDPVLLVMGFAVPGSGWQLQVEGLSPTHRVVTFDNRGIGRSDCPSGLYSTDQMAKETLSLMDHLGMERAHVVGISMGGMIAQKVALAAPRRVRTLALLATHGGGRQALARPATVRRFIQLQATKDPQVRLRLFNEILFTPAFVAEHGARLRDGMAKELGGLRQPANGFRGQMAAVFRHRTGAKLAALHGLPTLILHGEADAIVHPRNGHLLKEWMPWAQHRELPGVGHGINVQARDTVNAALLEHFRRG